DTSRAAERRPARKSAAIAITYAPRAIASPIQIVRETPTASITGPSVAHRSSGGDPPDHEDERGEEHRDRDRNDDDERPEPSKRRRYLCQELLGVLRSD